MPACDPNLSRARCFSVFSNTPTSMFRWAQATMTSGSRYGSDDSSILAQSTNFLSSNAVPFLTAASRSIFKLIAFGDTNLWR
jgi:hypothetical protein